METPDPFECLGRALAHLRKRAGFSTQTEAAETLKIDKGQLSRWENESPRPTLENLGRLLAGYNATVPDLGHAMIEAAAVARGSPTSESLVESLAAAMKRYEQRIQKLERAQLEQAERLEKNLGRETG